MWLPIVSGGENNNSSNGSNSNSNGNNNNNSSNSNGSQKTLWGRRGAGAAVLNKEYTFPIKLLGYPFLFLPPSSEHQCAGAASVARNS